MMKSFLLLILSLTTGCEASSMKGCEGGWVEFRCEYPKTNEKYQSINVVNPKRRNIQSRKEDTWENNGRVSLYHDTENKTLRVIIKSLQQEDFGEYRCKFEQESNSSDDGQERKEEENNQEVKKKLERHKKNSDDCQTFNQTAYRAAKTTITCGNKPDSRVKFLCKEKESTCEQILSTKSPPESNRKFTHDETSSDLSMSISNVSSQHDGVYWCGETSSDGTYRAGLRRIQLEVEDTITNFTRSPTSGQDFRAWCKYPDGSSIMKFLCKGEDPSICEPIVSTTKKNSGRFSLVVDHSKTTITLTVRGVTTEDTGTYWCGAESFDKRRSNVFVTKFFLTVVPPTTTHTPLPKERNGGSQFTIIIAVIVTGTVLVLVFVVVLAYNACGRSKNVEALKEDRAYEEIREHPRNPNSGTALKTIYATADFPKNPSESQNYSSVNSQNSSGEVSGHIYSTVRDEQGPTYSTVNHPTRIPNDPFYSTINSPQRH